MKRALAMAACAAAHLAAFGAVIVFAAMAWIADGVEMARIGGKR